uniref:Metallophosphoesterase n=1 Tax=Prevotella sp. GTC17254 TaxID=3236794 RepID=A0AB33J009_9BACT
MFKAFIAFLTALMVPDIYIWYHFIGTDAAWWVTLLYALPTVVLIGSFVAANLGFYHNTCLRIFFSLTLCVVLPKFVFTILSLLLPTWLALAIALALVASIAYGFIAGWRHLVVRRATCFSHLLPSAFDGFRILQFSDLHAGTFLKSHSFIKKLVEEINHLQPDLIVFTGDLVNVSADEIVPFTRYLRQLHAPYGVYSILGNHDYCEYGKDHTLQNVVRHQHMLRYMEEKMGWHLLLNEHVWLEKETDKIALIGVENISKPPFPTYGDLTKAMQGIPDGAYKILLSHDPTHWRLSIVGQTDIALTLSGHTHAGQVKIGRFSPARFAYREWGGIYKEARQTLYVSLGLGGTMPFRLGAWPEVNLLELRGTKS